MSGLSNEDMDRIQADNIAIEQRRIARIRAVKIRPIVGLELWKEVLIMGLASRKSDPVSDADRALIIFDERFS